MVRLKEIHEACEAFDMLFQFQYGTVERSSRRLSFSACHIFQFQYGTVERKGKDLTRRNSIISIPVWYG